MKVAILDDYQNAALRMADWRSLPSEVKVTVFAHHMADQAELTRTLAPFNCIVAMRERTAFPKTLIDQLPNLKLLITTGMSNASIDGEAAAARKIPVCGTDMHGPSTVELIWSLILAVSRHIVREAQDVREGKWQTTLGPGVAEKTIGLVGSGKLAGQTAAIGKAFGAKFIIWSQNLTPARAAEIGAESVSKEELFRRADLVSVNYRLSPRSRGLVGAAEFALMKPTAYFVNTSRGPIVDEKALIEVLLAKRIAGAALDVFDQEPLPLDHPFRRLENVIVTPHIGYVTEEGYRRAYGGAVECVRAFLKGEIRKPINKIA